MALAVYKATIIWKEEEKIKGLNLVKVLTQDQVLYFIVYEACFVRHLAVLIKHEPRVIFCAVASVMAYTVDLSQDLRNLFNTLGNPSLLCVLGSHLLIHLREAAEEGRNEGTSYRSKSLSMINFEQGEES